MGRDQTAPTSPLLKGQGEQNIGNSEIVRPQDGAATVIPQTNPPRIIRLEGGSGAGQTTSIVMTGSRIVGPQNPNPGFPGPVTGVIEFGNGGRFTRVEFDLPTGPYVGTIPPVGISNAVEPQDGGVIVTVPTAVVRAYARYDNQLLAPVLNTTPPLSLAQQMGVPVVGPGGQPSEPVLVKAMAAYFSKTRSKVYKTLYCYVGAAGTPAIQVAASYCLPAFAKTVKVLRFPLSAVLEIRLSDGIRSVDEYLTVAGTSFPELEVVGQEKVVSITSRTAGDSITFLALACEVGV